jgi:hypothetical protein
VAFLGGAAAVFLNPFWWQCDCGTYAEWKRYILVRKSAAAAAAAEEDFSALVRSSWRKGCYRSVVSKH